MEITGYFLGLSPSIDYNFSENPRTLVDDYSFSVNPETFVLNDRNGNRKFVAAYYEVLKKGKDRGGVII